MPLQLFFRWFFGLAADFIWPACWAEVLHDIESWLIQFQNFKLPAMVQVFSVHFHTYTWPLIEAFGTPCSFPDCTGNVLFGCRHWCGAVFWEEARNSIQRGTASFSWHLLAIDHEQCREKRDPNVSLGNYFSRGKLCIKVLFKMGNSRKYPYTTTDGFNILTPLALGNSKMRYPPMPSEFHNR